MEKDFNYLMAASSQEDRKTLGGVANQCTITERRLVQLQLTLITIPLFHLTIFKLPLGFRKRPEGVMRCFYEIDLGQFGNGFVGCRL